jgi:hypothetical protein
MKSMFLAAVLLAPGIWAADEVADRAGIELTIRALNLNPTRPGLFTSDFDSAELERFRKGAPGEIIISKEPMGEAIWLPAGMHLPLTIRKIRFVTDDVAVVDAAGKAPVLIVMRKVGTDWKIASLRILAL